MNRWCSKLSEYLPNFVLFDIVLGAISSKLFLRSTVNHRMSTQDIRSHPIRYIRNHSRRKTVLGVNLNVAPPSDNRDQEGTSSRVVPGDAPPARRGASSTPAPIDVEALDDDVIIISSPRALAEAKNSYTRTRGQVILVDEDSEDRLPKSNSRNKRRRVSTDQSTLIGDIYINLEANSSLKAVTAQSEPPRPIEPTFSCPICMGTLVEEMSTKCGHIFCKACIKASIAAQGKCPSCRRKITMKDTIRVYLPATR